MVFPSYERRIVPGQPLFPCPVAFCREAEGPLNSKSRGYYQLDAENLECVYSNLYKAGMQTMIQKDDARQAIAENIERLMTAFGWSQTELARQAGVKQVFVSRLLDQVMLPNAVDLANVAEALGTSSDALMRKSDTQKNPKKVARSA